MATPTNVRANDPKADGWLRMKDLTEATGLPKSTILHYVNQGLLPHTQKTGRNMAYYHPSTVERISFIREAQEKHRLPLTAIKRVLAERDKGHDVSALLQLQEVIFKESLPKYSGRAFLKATGLTASQLDLLLDVGVLLPLEDGRFDAEDVAVGRILKGGLDHGFDARDWEFYSRLAERMVEHEVRLRRRATRELSFEKDAEVTLLMTKAARALRGYIIDRTFQKRVLKLNGLKDSGSNKGGTP